MTYRKNLYKLNRIILPVILILVAGCSAITAASTPSTSEILSGELREIAVEDVNVQIGVGSPIPVDIFVSGSWPDLCSQLAKVNQNIEGFSIDISLLATPGKPDCPPDFLGIPFRIAIPINSVELPEGSYEVTVNGVSAAFEWKLIQ